MCNGNEEEMGKKSSEEKLLRERERNKKDVEQTNWKETRVSLDERQGALKCVSMTTHVKFKNEREILE